MLWGGVRDQSAGRSVMHYRRTVMDLLYEDPDCTRGMIHLPGTRTSATRITLYLNEVIIQKYKVNYSFFQIYVFLGFLYRKSSLIDSQHNIR